MRERATVVFIFFYRYLPGCEARDMCRINLAEILYWDFLRRVWEWAGRRQK